MEAELVASPFDLLIYGVISARLEVWALGILTLTLTSIDITLAINARRRGRRCTVLSFFRNCGDPFSYLTRVLGFSTTPFFS